MATCSLGRGTVCRIDSAAWCQDFEEFDINNNGQLDMTEIRSMMLKQVCTKKLSNPTKYFTCVEYSLR